MSWPKDPRAEEKKGITVNAGQWCGFVSNLSWVPSGKGKTINYKGLGDISVFCGLMQKGFEGGSELPAQWDLDNLT